MRIEWQWFDGTHHVRVMRTQGEFHVMAQPGEEGSEPHPGQWVEAPRGSEGHTSALEGLIGQMLPPAL